MFAIRSADIGAHLTGSTVPKLSQHNLNRITFIKPPSRILTAFGEQTRSMFDRIHASQAESLTLATLRDTLLPKLLIGGIQAAGLTAIQTQ
jgi:type I restriction enzyme, S subunit